MANILAIIYGVIFSIAFLFFAVVAIFIYRYKTYFAMEKLLFSKFGLNFYLFAQEDSPGAGDSGHQNDPSRSDPSEAHRSGSSQHQNESDEGRFRFANEPRI